MTKNTLPFDYAFMIMRDNPLKYTISYGCMHLGDENDIIYFLLMMFIRNLHE